MDADQNLNNNDDTNYNYEFNNMVVEETENVNEITEKMMLELVRMQLLVQVVEILK